VGALPGGVTVTVTAVVARPLFGPVAVRVYVVVLVGDTFTVPLGGKVPDTVLMVTCVALVVVQLRMAGDPDVIVAGVAVKEVIAVPPLLGDGLLFWEEAPIPRQPLSARRKARTVPASKHLKPHFTVMFSQLPGDRHIRRFADFDEFQLVVRRPGRFVSCS
jgi:hypothetical protein